MRINWHKNYLRQNHAICKNIGVNRNELSTISTDVQSEKTIKIFKSLIQTIGGTCKLIECNNRSTAHTHIHTQNTTHTKTHKRCCERHRLPKEWKQQELLGLLVLGKGVYLWKRLCRCRWPSAKGRWWCWLGKTLMRLDCDDTMVATEHIIVGGHSGSHSHSIICFRSIDQTVVSLKHFRILHT